MCYINSFTVVFHNKVHTVHTIPDLYYTVLIRWNMGKNPESNFWILPHAPGNIAMCIIKLRGLPPFSTFTQRSGLVGNTEKRWAGFSQGLVPGPSPCWSNLANTAFEANRKLVDVVREDSPHHNGAVDERLWSHMHGMSAGNDGSELLSLVVLIGSLRRCWQGV